MNKHWVLIMSISVVMQAEGAGHEPASGRDPFQPPGGEQCAPAEAFADWRIRGLIGRHERWSGWLAQQTAGWRKIGLGDVLPGAWRIARLDKRGAELIAAAPSPQCGHESKSVVLPSPFIRREARP